MLNAARIQVLKCKEDHIKTVLEETRQQLGAITEKPDQYRVLLEKLLLQGLLQLIEDVSVALFLVYFNKSNCQIKILLLLYDKSNLSGSFSL